MQTIPTHRKPRKCLHCNNKTVVEISYGEPTEEAMELAAQGKLVIGGCILTDRSPQWQCVECGTTYLKQRYGF